MKIQFKHFIRRHRKMAVLSLVVVLAAGAGIGMLRLRAGAPVSGEGGALEYARTVTLEKGELNESVNVSGTVESAELSSVTTLLTAKVKTVSVKIGDQVNKGDIICTLDDTDLRKELADKKQSLTQEQQKLKEAYERTLAQVQTAKDSKKAEQSVQDLRVSEAQRTLNSAKAALDAVTPAYNAAKSNYSTMMTAVSPWQNAADAAAAASQAAYNTWIAAGGTSTGMEYEAYQAAQADLTEKQAALDEARKLYNADAYSAALETAQQAYDPAAAAVQAAQAAFEQATAARHQTLDSIDATINQAVAAALDAKKQMDQGVSAKEIEELEKKLEDTVLRAETSGKITELKVNVGSLCKGDVATIQSTEKLIVSVKIPEYAIGKVTVGMAVNLTSDAVAGTIPGTLARISPTASEGESGGFPADVAVNKPESLFIGSKAKAEIIISSKTNVFTVPLDAVRQNSAGQDVILVKQADGTFAETPVTTGARNDYFVEVSSSRIAAGAEVLADAAQDGMDPDAEPPAAETENAETENNI
ncbi:hypothetical protein CE91St44_19650 [Oscillospiraceae bacterium]|nr:hypothetical protein CE91St44_19650 [Oscillospiraceae bacterium]